MTINPTTMRIFKVILLAVFIVVMWQWIVYMFPFTNAPSDSMDDKHPKVLTVHEVNDKLMVSVLPTRIVEVYYEALCPDSRQFVMQQLRPTFKKLSEHIDIRYVPYGKASTKILPDGTFKFTCQHGPKECKSNKVHACVAKHVSNVQNRLFIIICMIDKAYHREAFELGKECTLKFEENWDPIDQCSKGEEGDAILHHMGKMTHNLSPKVTFIPTITIDGTQNPQPLMLQDLSKAICRTYDSEKPTGCT